MPRFDVLLFYVDIFQLDEPEPYLWVAGCALVGLLVSGLIWGVQRLRTRSGGLPVWPVALGTGLGLLRSPILVFPDAAYLLLGVVVLMLTATGAIAWLGRSGRTLTLAGRLLPLLVATVGVVGLLAVDRRLGGVLNYIEGTRPHHIGSPWTHVLWFYLQGTMAATVWLVGTGLVLAGTALWGRNLDRDARRVCATMAAYAISLAGIVDAWRAMTVGWYHQSLPVSRAAWDFQDSLLWGIAAVAGWNLVRRFFRSRQGKPSARVRGHILPYGMFGCVVGLALVIAASETATRLHPLSSSYAPMLLEPRCHWPVCGPTGSVLVSPFTQRPEYPHFSPSISVIDVRFAPTGAPSDAFGATSP